MTLASFRGLDDGLMKDESGYMVKMGYVRRKRKLELKEVQRGRFFFFFVGFLLQGNGEYGENQ